MLDMPKKPTFICDPVDTVIGVVMGFDFGLKRIGVAVGQSLTKTATPISPLKAKRGEPSWQEVEQYIKKWQPGALVVGIPLNMDGTEQPIGRAALKFAQQLKQRFSLPVHGADERLTSFAARQQLFEAGGYKAIQKNSIDSLAASIILEAWLAEYGQRHD